MKFAIHRLLAAISPETYCVPAKRRDVRRVLDEGLKRGDPLAVRRAAELAEPMPANDVAPEELQHRSAFDPVVLRHPLERHTFSCDSMEQSLEAFYFTLLDFLESHGWQVTKLVDHLDSAAGSGFGGDLSRRATKSQQRPPGCSKPRRSWWRRFCDGWNASRTWNDNSRRKRLVAHHPSQICNQALQISTEKVHLGSH